MQRFLGLVNKLMWLVRILLFLYILHQLLYGTGIMPTIVSSDLPTIDNLIKEDSDYFKYILIDEFNNNAYFYKNNTFAHTLSISKHSDFGQTVNQLYNATNSQPISIYYSNQKSFLSYAFDLVFYWIFINLVFMILGRYIGKISVPGLNKADDEIFTPVKPDPKGTKFKDVIGNEEGKQNMMECIKYFKHRKEYLDVGFEIPKGLLLVGKPGTGKTLMARAFANEANINFISACGSDFMELYVGMGPKRVRELFEIARKNTPCIIFIDEIDAIGSRREGNLNHSEKTNTLNKLLQEMDGFNVNEDIMILAATNMVNALDKALIRSGRFDKQIFFDPPNIDERKDMFKLYLGQIKLDSSFSETNEVKEENLDKLSRMTAGLTGADIRNVCKEATRTFMNRINVNSPEFKNSGVTYEDLNKSIDIVTIGMEKPERRMSDKEREIVSYHEAGHSLVAYMLKSSEPPIKVSIIPRGKDALGFSQQEPNDKKLFTKEELTSRLSVLLGGRMAEKLIYDHYSTGAADDIERATKLAYSMITNYGMADDIGPINPTFNIEHISDSTKYKIDCKVLELIKEVESNTYKYLEDHKDELEKVAKFLLEKEVLLSEDLDELLEEFNIKNTI